MGTVSVVQLAADVLTVAKLLPSRVFVAPLDVCPDYPLRTGLVHRCWAGAFSAQAKTMVEGLPIFST